ncbi:unnamed protein product [Rotaria sordida]|uniref:MULE transposase domain-containing protein n=1 Tax=Rotaria sordida TaxID=392033 RepID=A0A814L751_9BILA|nr:unnamed protein product [Rotaria sordida]CAF4107736.1 unnamed protein product [Rotaria sordida]
MCAVIGCTIRIQTDENDIYLCGGKGIHDHEGSSDLIDTIHLRQQIKQRVVNELTPINMIYEQEVAKASLSISALATFPTNHEIYQTFAKARQKILPPLPQSCLFTIPDPYKLTVGGKRFLLFDESRVRRERLLIYASDLQLEILFKSSVVYMDGTFSKTPPHFYQVYIIHGVNYDICVPCVFVLILNKKNSTYRQIFFELKQLALERQTSFSPNLIVTDFESGVLPVVKIEFPASRHYECHFHYNQCIFRQIQHLGPQGEYSRNELIRVLCRKLMALALMPCDLVLAGYDEIRNDVQSLSN